jgi:hypothetical protein
MNKSVSIRLLDCTQAANLLASRLMGVSTSKLQSASGESDLLVKRETLELVRAYYKIADARARKRVFELTKAVAKAAK